MERGEKSPSLDTLIKLSNILNIPTDSLLGSEINMYSSSQLKYLEKQLKELPLQEQEKLLDIFDYIISAELSCYKKKK